MASAAPGVEWRTRQRWQWPQTNMEPIIQTVFDVNDPTGKPVRVELAVSAPQKTGENKWTVMVACPAIPYASASYTREDPLTCLCFALKLVRMHMRDEFSKGYTVDGWAHIGDFVDEVFFSFSEPREKREQEPSATRSIDYKKLLQDISFLVGSFPGIHSASAWHKENLNYLSFQCESFETLSRLTGLAQMANLRLYVGVRLWFSIEIPDETRASAPNNTEILGIAMARELKAMKILSAEVADEYQKAWNAAIT